MSYLPRFLPILLALPLLLVSVLDAEERPPMLPGWTHENIARSSNPTRDGVILDGGDVGMSSPVVANVDGNPANGNEVVAAGADGTLYVYSASGAPLWTATTPNAACGSATNRIYSSPAVGAILGDGVPYVVVGYGGFGRDCDGGVVAHRGADGAVLWNFSLRAFAAKRKFRENYATVFSTPALADTNGDGKMEIGFGGHDRNVYLLNADGSVRWYYNAADTVFSSPAFANVDRDRDLEMIIGTDISRNDLLRPPTKDGGMMYAFKTRALPKRSPRHNFRSKKAFVWSRAFDQVMQSSPAVADLLPSVKGVEIVVGSGCFFPQGTKDKRGRWLRILSSRNGRTLKTLPTPACAPSSPALGDVNEDGVIDIVAVVSGSPSLGGDGQSKVIAYSAETGLPIWSTVLNDRGYNDPYAGNYLSAVIADVDGNGSLEVLATNGPTVSVLNGRDGTPLTCQSADCGPTGAVTLYSGDRMKSTPAVGDLDGDGKLEVVGAGGAANSGGRGALFAWTSLSGLLGSPVGSKPPYSAPWPMFRGNPARSGVHQ